MHDRDNRRNTNMLSLLCLVQWWDCQWWDRDVKLSRMSHWSLVGLFLFFCIKNGVPTLFTINFSLLIIHCDLLKSHIWCAQADSNGHRLLRRQLLYPAKLWAHLLAYYIIFSFYFQALMQLLFFQFFFVFFFYLF